VTYGDTVTGPDGHPLDQIRLTGVTAVGYHGVLPAERVEGQTFRADVVLHLDTSAAAVSDDLDATVSYAEVAEDVHAILAGDPVDLVETVAERVAAVVLARPAVHAVDVRVHKPEAPIAVPFEDVEIVVRRDRVRLPSVPLPVLDAEPAGSAAEPAAVAPALTLVPDVVEDEVPAAPDVAAAVAVPPPPAPEPETAVEPEPEVHPLDRSPEHPVDAVIALGANLGDPQATLRAAVTDVDRVPGVQVMEVSPLARTAAVGPEQPDYLNAVLLVRTTLSPRDLLSVCQEVELLHGRVREERWGPRTLDVDVVQYDTLTVSSDDLELPHPRAHERAFVLVPWAELDPEAVLGGLGGGPVAQLAATAPDRGGIRWLALDWLTEPALTGPVPVQPEPVAEELAVEDQAPAQDEPQPGLPDAGEEPPAPASHDAAGQPHGEPTPAWGAPQPAAWEPEQPPAWQPEQGPAEPQQPQAWAPEQPQAPQGWSSGQEPEQPPAWVPEPPAAPAEPVHGATPPWTPQQGFAEPQQPSAPQAAATGWTPEPVEEPAAWAPQPVAQPVWEPAPAAAPAPETPQTWQPEQPQAWQPEQPQAWQPTAAAPVVEATPWAPAAPAPADPPSNHAPAPAAAVPAPPALVVPSYPGPQAVERPAEPGRADAPSAADVFPASVRQPEQARPQEPRAAEPYRPEPTAPAFPPEQYQREQYQPEPYQPQQYTAEQPAAPYRPEAYAPQAAPAFPERQEPPAYVPEAFSGPQHVVPATTVQAPPSVPPQGFGGVGGADPAGRA
jgi:dihydroneopterin aldolase/2-amino-4-hydroxy-6-hydroxymethyldihydropteridine diphosphokinase